MNYECPYRFIPKASQETVKCERTWEAMGEALCSPQECCIDLNSVPSPKGFEQLGLGFCTDVAPYVTSTSHHDQAIEISTCAAECELEPQCKFFSLWPGHQCRRFADLPGGCSGRPRGGQHEGGTYIRTSLAPVNYKYIERPVVAHKGRGFPGSRLSPLVSLDACKQACDEEWSCKNLLICYNLRNPVGAFCNMHDRLITAADANDTSHWYWNVIGPCATWYKEKTP
eukprot:TRINITY_DN37463_c0_g2_i2.p1 TRINITY_DN37463_c0_g2~~TRINITY_DN37463_c0_g2_i2.p1  ORF type:complete len:227 (+),score=25.07 TRINITY_DN37463_c0_g2_i2:75-755(+)